MAKKRGVHKGDRLRGHLERERIKQAKNETPEAKHIACKPPEFMTGTWTIVGTVALVMSRFSKKAMHAMIKTQEQGERARNVNKKRAKKDFEAEWKDRTYRSAEGWSGFNAAGMRNAMISACRVASLVMTKMKLCIFVEPDGWDVDTDIPLVRITKGVPRRFDAAVRNKNGSIDIRARPRWDAGWHAVLRIRYDAGQFEAEDITNLLMRVGMQVGLCEGRADSKDSAGCGWGFFTFKNKP